jgi:DNA adenine methylase
MPIWVNDKYYFLYNFWTQLRDNPDILQKKLYDLKSYVDGNDEAHKTIFNKYQSRIKDLDPIEQAVAFFVLNKCSYSGLTENSTFSIQASQSNFSLIGIDKLPKFSKIIKNWKITNLDYSEVISSPGSDVFIFLDPPYDIKSFLYGTDRQLHEGFSHEKFADEVDKCQHKFMITYNLNEWLVGRYKKYNLKKWKLRYSMIHRGNTGTDDNVKTELLVTNYPIPS